MHGLQCIGHRGAKAHAPENTLASFRTALEMGVHGVELDVHLVDEQLVVIHDDNLDRTTNGMGSIYGHTAESLRGFDAGDGERIPLLDEIFNLIAGRVGINIELKGPGTASPVVAAVSAQLDRGWTRDRILISSFQHDELATVRRLAPEARIGVLFKSAAAESLATARDLAACAVIPALKLIDENLVTRAHEDEFKVIVFTVNEPQDIARMARIGVDGVISDYPGRVLETAPCRVPRVGWD